MIRERQPIRGLVAGLALLAALAAGTAAASCEAESTRVNIQRLQGNPIVHPGMDARMGSNVQGPSLIRVPDWINDPLGRYYLYFADHKGDYIRLAYANQLEGPWKVHPPGSLRLDQSHFRTEAAAVPADFEVTPQMRVEGVKGVPIPIDSFTKPHIASPDVHVRDDRREIVMYFHGLEDFRFQRTRAATSVDGLHFEAREPLIGRSYLRAFLHDGKWYALGMPGEFYRSDDGISDFEVGPTLFPRTMRHAGLLKRDDTLFVFWSNVGDEPEHIVLSTIDISADWSGWSASEPRSVLEPETDWEGADRPLVASVRDAINVRVNQLRDPAIYQEDGRIYLLYAIAGEAGIAIAELTIDC
ncbi:MAG: hypothetical protein VYE73_10820 [Acidobacteriota bacterium]|nr:hypothetical protein [Acidobacteriota bacterium]